MSELTFTLPWPPSINSMYQVGIIGAKRNLEEPFVAVLEELEKGATGSIADVIKFAKSEPKVLRSMVKEAFGSPRASMFLTDAGKEYRQAAADALDDQHVPRRSVHGRLEVSVVAYPPDKRIRDLSNLWKSALDILQHCNVIENDGHFDREQIERGPERKGGAFVVTIREKADAFESRQQGFDLAPAPTPASAPAPF